MSATTAPTTATSQSLNGTSNENAGQRRLSRQVAADAVAIGDGLAVVIGGLLPALIYAVVGEVKLDHLLLVQSTVIAGFIAVMCLRFRKMYDTSRMDLFPQAPTELFIALCCGLGGVLGIGLPLALHNIHLAVWYSSWVSASFLLILLNRILARFTLAQLAAAGRFDQRIAVFGAGQIAKQVHDYLRAPNLGIFLRGVYDDRIGQDRLNPEGMTVNGRLDDLVEECRQGRIDRVIIALPQSAHQRLASVVEKFDRLPISTHIVTHISSDLLETDIAYKVSNLGPVGLLDVKKKHS